MRFYTSLLHSRTHSTQEKSEVTATYNAATVGKFNKTVTAFTNTGTPITLMLKGKVIPKQGQTQP